MSSALSLTATGGNGLPPFPIDAEEVRRALELLVDREAGCQIFTLPDRRKEDVKGSDIDALVQAVRHSDDQAGIYLVLNSLPLGFNEYAKNKDITKRRWLFIDIDRIKNEFDKYAASEEEHELTREAAEDLRIFLCEERGWPMPLVIDSGNGHYLLFRIDLPNDDHATALVKTCLKVIAKQVNGKGSVDIKVSDARRVARIPGTWNRTKLQEANRVWRQCRILYAPERLEIVTAEMLAEVGSCRQEEACEGACDKIQPRANKSALTLTAGSPGAIAYVRRAIELECSAVATARPGERNDRLNKAAFNLAGFIPAGHVTRELIEYRLFDAARDCGLFDDPGCGERGVRATITSGIDAGLQNPRIIKDRDAEADRAAKVGESTGDRAWSFYQDDELLASGEAEEILAPIAFGNEKSQKRVFQIYTGPALMRTKFPAPTWVIQGMLSEGLNILAGKPKMGKSILALNLGLTISGGGLALGNTAVEQGDVLYLALEDKFRRLQTRAGKMIASSKMHITDHFSLATEWPRCNCGGLLLMDKWIEKVANPRLIIIDVWPMFKPSPNPGLRRSAYDEDYTAFGDLKKFCDHRGINCLVLLHCRKGLSEDVLDEVSGTLGQVGASDGILILNRSRTNGEATVFVCGRDVEEQELALSFDLPSLTWKSLGPSAEHVRGKLQEKILEYLKSHRPSTAHQIAMGIDSTRESVQKVLHRFFDKQDKSPVDRIGDKWALKDQELF